MWSLALPPRLSFTSNHGEKSTGDFSALSTILSIDGNRNWGASKELRLCENEGCRGGVNVGRGGLLRRLSRLVDPCFASSLKKSTAKLSPMGFRHREGASKQPSEPFNPSCCILTHLGISSCISRATLAKALDHHQA